MWISDKFPITDIPRSITRQDAAAFVQWNKLFLWFCALLIFFHFSFEIESCHICQLHLCHFQIRNYPYMLFITDFFFAFPSLSCQFNFVPIFIIHAIFLTFVFIFYFPCFIALHRLEISRRKRKICECWFVALLQSLKRFCRDLLCLFCWSDKSDKIYSRIIAENIESISAWLSK